MWEKRFELLSLAYLVSSRRASFWVAFSAVYWSVSVRFEWNFTFLAAISADCLMHLSVSIHSLSQLLILCCAKIAFLHDAPNVCGGAYKLHAWSCGKSVECWKGSSAIKRWGDYFFLACFAGSETFFLCFLFISFSLWSCLCLSRPAILSFLLLGIS